MHLQESKDESDEIEKSLDDTNTKIGGAKAAIESCNQVDGINYPTDQFDEKLDVDDMYSPPFALLGLPIYILERP